MKPKNRLPFLLISILSVLLLSAAVHAEPSGKLIIYHAGSLSVPLAAMEKAFEAAHPRVDIVRKGGGSTKMARLISEKGESADIMASADYTVIDKNLIPSYADWNVRFATNQLVLCYTDQSRMADNVSAATWPDVLATKGVVWGHSDPDLDPCGYRALMVLQLAETHLNRPGLYDALLANRPAENVRPKAVELVSMLKSHKMDYAWEYLSVAVQHGLNHVVLDDQINLGNYQYNDSYKQAAVQVAGKKPGTMITRKGKSITYGITLLKNAPNPEAATAFLAFMLNPDHGLKTLQSMGQPPFIPCRVPDAAMYEKLPNDLKELVAVKN